MQILTEEQSADVRLCVRIIKDAIRIYVVLPELPQMDKAFDDIYRIIH